MYYGSMAQLTFTRLFCRDRGLIPLHRAKQFFLLVFYNSCKFLQCFNMCCINEERSIKTYCDMAIRQKDVINLIIQLIGYVTL